MRPQARLIPLKVPEAVPCLGVFVVVLAQLHEIVLLGLGWGLVSVWIFAVQAFFGKNFTVLPETPDASLEESAE